MQAKPIAITIAIFAVLAVLADTWLAHSSDSLLLFGQSQVAPMPPSRRSLMAAPPASTQEASKPIIADDSLLSTLSVAQKLQDLSLVARIEKRLFRVKELQSIDFQVEARSGEIVINGKVPGEKEVQRALRIVQNVAGVRSIINEIEVQ